MTEQKNAQQFADRLRTALDKQSRRRAGGLRRRTGSVSSSTRSFADRLRSSLDVR